MAFIAATVFASASLFAQKDVTFTITKMESEKGWTKDMDIDGKSYEAKVGITFTFNKADGETSPTYAETTTSSGATQCVAHLNVGNTLTITSSNKTFTKIVFSPTKKSLAPLTNDKGEANYEMTDGTFTGANKPTYTWEGETSSYFIKNKINAAGFQFNKITVTYVDGYTGVEHVSTIDLTDGKVYSIDGQYVGKGKESVTKSGVYVVNGKKTIIRK